MGYIVLRLEGGLGNQLFQLTFARSVQRLNGGNHKILIDRHTYRSDNLRDIQIGSLYGLDTSISNYSIKHVFIIIIARIKAIAINSLDKLISSISGTLAVDRKARFGLYRQIGPTYRDYLYVTNSKIIYIYGNWFSHKYCLNSADSAYRFNLDFEKNKSKKYKHVLRAIRSGNSTCIHIRRGDYLSNDWSKSLNICDSDYFKRGITRIKELVSEPLFFVFSNSSEDLSFIKDNFHFEEDVVYVDLANDAIDELYLMSNCKNIIMSNSTYSYWASELINYDKKIVISPSKWNSGIWDMNDIFRESWQCLDI